MTNAFLFPGQGSQAVGMGADFAAAFPAARRRFDEAGDLLGTDLAALCFGGPEEELRATQNTQPALFVVEAVINDLLVDKGIVPSFTMGHSLGEYSALYAAGALSFADGVRLVATRGKLMARAGTAAPGAMAAVMGLPRERIAEVLRQVTEGVVVCANENSPDQTVISGEVAAVNAACDKLKDAGAKRALLLPVSGAFHSPLMQQAAAEFEAVVARTAFSRPRCPVISNVTAQAESDPASFPGLLVKQLVSPVRWTDSVRFLGRQGKPRCIEAGPGSVLQGLVRNIDSELSVVPCGKVENLFSLAS